MPLEERTRTERVRKALSLSLCCPLG